jgi:hypothetical protein
MKQPEDNVTAELPLPKTRRKYASDAEKQAAYRARKGVTAMTVVLSNEVHAAFVAKLAAQGKKPSAIVEKLIKTQFLRER